MTAGRPRRRRRSKVEEPPHRRSHARAVPPAGGRGQRRARRAQPQQALGGRGPARTDAGAARRAAPGRAAPTCSSRPSGRARSTGAASARRSCCARQPAPRLLLAHRLRPGTGRTPRAPATTSDYIALGGSPRRPTRRATATGAARARRSPTWRARLVATIGILAALQARERDGPRAGRGRLAARAASPALMTMPATRRSPGRQPARRADGRLSPATASIAAGTAAHLAVGRARAEVLGSALCRALGLPGAASAGSGSAAARAGDDRSAARGSSPARDRDDWVRALARRRRRASSPCSDPTEACTHGRRRRAARWQAAGGSALPHGRPRPVRCRATRRRSGPPLRARAWASTRDEVLARGRLQRDRDRGDAAIGAVA